MLRPIPRTRVPLAAGARRVARRYPGAVHVVLVHPEIPQNTGAIGRLTAAWRPRLHLVEPLGFSLDERRVRRAGLDYWHLVDLTVHPDVGACSQISPRRRARPLEERLSSRPAPVRRFVRRRCVLTTCWSSGVRATACRRKLVEALGTARAHPHP